MRSAGGYRPFLRTKRRIVPLKRATNQFNRLISSGAPWGLLTRRVLTIGKSIAMVAPLRQCICIRKSARTSRLGGAVSRNICSEIINIIITSNFYNNNITMIILNTIAYYCHNTVRIAETTRIWTRHTKS